MPFIGTDKLPKGADTGEPYAAFMENLASFPHFKISSMTVVRSNLIYTTKNGQLMKMKLFDKPEEVGKIAYLTEPFNQSRVTGLDTCVSKMTVITTSDDCYLRLYTYQNGPLKLILQEKVDKYITGLSMHPSGMYLATATGKQLNLYTICKKKFVCYNSIPMQECNVVRFSHGGQFVAAQAMNDVHIFKFFTGERMIRFDCAWHKASILTIHWLPDDDGIVSTSQDKFVQVWKFEDEASRHLWDKNPEDKKMKPYKRGFHTFSSIQSAVVELEVPHGIKERRTELVVYGACTDGTFSEIKNSKDVARLECQTVFSNIRSLKGLNGPRAFLAGTIRDNMPGSIRVI
jgi:WD40 repeat protein